MKKEEGLLWKSWESVKKILNVKKKDKTIGDKKNKGLIYIILITGILFLTIPSFFQGKEAPLQNKLDFTAVDEERRLEEILSKIEGVGECRVMISYKSSKEYVIAKDKTKDGEKGEEKNVITGSGNSEKPFVIREEMPVVRGVIVVCTGGGDEVIRNNVKEAVCAICGVGAGKVKVYKK